jgi:addiction module HigA family antidote
MKPDKLVPAPPVSPGKILRDYILAEDKITQDILADAMGVSRFSVNQIVNGRRSITAEMALRLSRVMSTTPDFWLDLQRAVDLYEARLKIGSEVERLKVLRRAKSKSELFEYRD